MNEKAVKFFDDVFKDAIGDFVFNGAHTPNSLDDDLLDSLVDRARDVAILASKKREAYLEAKGVKCGDE